MNNNDTEIPEDQYEAHALQLDAKDFVSRSKAKNNPQRREHSRTEFGQMLNQGNICSPIMKCQRNGFDFCIMEIYLNKRKEQFNSGELKKFFRNISHFVVFGLMASGRKEREEETRKDTSIVLIYQEQSFTSELKTMMDLKNNDTEVLEDLLEEQALQRKVKDFACR